MCCLYGVCLFTEEIVHSKRIEKAEYRLMYIGINFENKCLCRHGCPDTTYFSLQRGKKEMRELLVAVQEELKTFVTYIQFAVLPNNRKATNMVAKGTEILSSTTSVTGIHSTTVAANATRTSLPIA